MMMNIDGENQNNNTAPDQTGDSQQIKVRASIKTQSTNQSFKRVLVAQQRVKTEQLLKESLVGKNMQFDELDSESQKSLQLLDSIQKMHLSHKYSNQAIGRRNDDKKIGFKQRGGDRKQS